MVHLPIYLEDLGGRYEEAEGRGQAGCKDTSSDEIVVPRHLTKNLGGLKYQSVISMTLKVHTWTSRTGERYLIFESNSWNNISYVYLYYVLQGWLLDNNPWVLFTEWQLGSILVLNAGWVMELNATKMACYVSNNAHWGLPLCHWPGQTDSYLLGCSQWSSSPVGRQDQYSPLCSFLAECYSCYPTHHGQQRTLNGEHRVRGSSPMMSSEKVLQW